MIKRKITLKNGNKPAKPKRNVAWNPGAKPEKKRKRSQKAVYNDGETSVRSAERSKAAIAARHESWAFNEQDEEWARSHAKDMVPGSIWITTTEMSDPGWSFETLDASKNVAMYKDTRHWGFYSNKSLPEGTVVMFLGQGRIDAFVGGYRRHIMAQKLVNVFLHGNEQIVIESLHCLKKQQKQE